MCHMQANVPSTYRRCLSSSSSRQPACCMYVPRVREFHNYRCAHSVADSSDAICSFQARNGPSRQWYDGTKTADCVNMCAKRHLNCADALPADMWGAQLH